ncbi:glycosyl hydrolase [Granulicella tundricola]|uniref:Glycoside hydrolase family 2 sugar binding protein n=1 Tax=Granulicella tundricola (strain ATCC BAA-1859 / DSM 23138 / MP5ACTX9) TaxID=1198114 RepID=E8X4E6_GRATM|nr:glycosyl hydrolase [Granulicella tundricola]ADW68273.1 hypothetical protein AciX9_1210 [Granulicella tundricola MP5ACTX9]
MKKVYSGLFRSAALAGVVGLSLSGVGAVAQVAAVERGFVSPPNEAKPMVRWWWFGPAVEKPEIRRELEQMKADGLGGAELAFVYPEVLDDAAKGLKNEAFLSPGMLGAVTYAQAEGRRLGLRIDLTLCSGWPYGGPATTLEEAAGRLRMVALPLANGALPMVKLGDGDQVVGRFVAQGDAKKWDAATAKPVTDGAVPAGSSSSSDRVALFFVAGHTKQMVKRAAVGAEGYVLDPFSKEAVATHLKAVGEPLVKAFGGTPPYAIFSDSLEAYGADWTPKLPEEFKKRRGYDLMVHLPELWAGGTAAADKVRHDYGRTLTELVDDNYLVQINDWAKAHGTKFRSQTYGEPAVSLSSQRLVDLAEGEGPQWRAFSTLRWATSANHDFGKTVTSGETFTWLHSPVFRATPLDMKAEADIDFIMGENQLIYHGWPYSAPQVGEPGWSLYAAAVFNDHNPWHPVMPAVSSYIGRMSYLMRQGKAANQVAVLLPTDDAWAGFSPGKVTVSGAMAKLISPGLMSAVLMAGYNLDYTDADAVNRVGVGHPVLVLPPTDRIPVETLRKIAAYVKGGGKVVAVGRVPSMDEEGAASAEVTRLAGELFGGEHFVADVGGLGEALRKLAAPDLLMTPGGSEAVGFIRRKLTDGDVYFVVNTSNEAVKATARFGTSYKVGAQWNPETGAEVGMVSAADTAIELAPYESAVYVFSGRPAGNAVGAGEFTAVNDLSRDWKVTFTSAAKTVNEAALTDWMADPATLHYSGEAVYSREFTLAAAPKGPVYLEIEGGKALPGSPSSPPEHRALGADGLPDPKVTGTGPGMHAYFEPPIREAALVTINGNAAGALWHPPYRLDVSKLLKPGVNHIEIKVYNTALNAWSALPPHDYKPLVEKYGDRFQMQDLNRVQALPSGLLGSIHLVTQGAQ